MKATWGWFVLVLALANLIACLVFLLHWHDIRVIYAVSIMDLFTAVISVPILLAVSLRRYDRARERVNYFLAQWQLKNSQPDATQANKLRELRDLLSSINLMTEQTKIDFTMGSLLTSAEFHGFLSYETHDVEEIRQLMDHDNE